MISPTELYDITKKLDDVRDIAYNRLFETYLKYELKGDKKLLDIDSTDQETVLKRLTFGRPVPGMIYTFIHLNEKNLAQIQNLATGKSISFHDFTPILFCTSFNPINKLMKGLNLTMLPSSERLKFLQAYYDNYKDFLKNIEEKTEYNKMGSLMQPVQFLPNSEKDDEWRAWNLDWLEWQGVRQLRRNAVRLLKIYKLAKGIIVIRV